MNAARHLDDDGAFVVETAVPSAWIGEGAYARPERVETDAVTLDVCSYDPVTQVLDENHVRISADGIELGPISCRLAWPSELDLMARIAGLELAETAVTTCQRAHRERSDRRGCRRCLPNRSR